MALTKTPIELSSTPSIVDGGNATAITIDSSENVGIGNSSPTEMLTLGSTSDTNVRLQFLSSTSGANTIQFGDGTVAAAYRGYINYTHSDDALAFATAGAERMRISGGNVGINQSSPSFALCISDDSNPNRNGLEIAIGTSDTASNTIQNYNRATSAYTPLNIAGSILTFGVGTNATERMRITTSGNVGIGNPSPGAAFHVDPAANVTTDFGTPLIKVGGDNSWAGNGSLYSVGFGYVDNSISNKSPAEIGIKTTTNAGYTKGDLVFATREVTTNTAPTERMRIDADGQVGVSSRKGFRFGNNLLQGNAGSSGGGYPTIGYNIAFTSTAANFGTLVGDTSWRIDIGNNNRLQVHSRSSANPVSSGAAYTAGPYVALNGTTWTGGSDERLKENISVITGADAIARVKAMRPVNYSWIHDSESANQLGFIAQEMLSAVPEVVDVPETETDPITHETLMWGITYDRLIPVLTAALQEALTKIETLEARVQTLENN